MLSSNTSYALHNNILYSDVMIFLILGAYMEETDVWGTLTEHNSVIFHDNDVSILYLCTVLLFMIIMYNYYS